MLSLNHTRSVTTSTRFYFGLRDCMHKGRWTSLSSSSFISLIIASSFFFLKTLINPYITLSSSSIFLFFFSTFKFDFFSLIYFFSLFLAFWSFLDILRSFYMIVHVAKNLVCYLLFQRRKRKFLRRWKSLCIISFTGKHFEGNHILSRGFIAFIKSAFFSFWYMLLAPFGQMAWLRM